MFYSRCSLLVLATYVCIKTVAGKHSCDRKIILTGKVAHIQDSTRIKFITVVEKLRN